MSTPHAPFSDRAEMAGHAFVAPRQGEAPGFYLLDDAGGRFVVDRALGVVSLRDETALERERGSVHAARLRVIEPSGACYEIEMKLRLTGRVPKMVGAEDIDFLGEAPAPDAPAPKPAQPGAWSAYAAVAADGPAAPINERARFGAAIERPALVRAAGPYRLHLFTPPPPHAEKTAIWSL